MTNQIQNFTSTLITGVSIANQIADKMYYALNDVISEIFSMKKADESNVDIFERTNIMNFYYDIKSIVDDAKDLFREARNDSESLIRKINDLHDTYQYQNSCELKRSMEEIIEKVQKLESLESKCKELENSIEKEISNAKAKGLKVSYEKLEKLLQLGM